MSELGEISHFHEEIDIQRKIVEQLLNNENLETKTELSKPLRWSCMNSVKEFIQNHNLPISSSILQNFINTSFRYLISNKRKGREEYIKALNALNNSLSEKEEIKNPIVGH